MNSFGMTPKEYLELYNKQDGCCAICGVECEPDEKLLAVDHDNRTGEVRGLLCTRCNLGLGYFKDSIRNLRRAAVYLGYVDESEEF